MYFNLIMVKIDSKYCDYLRNFDKRVSYNKDKKDLRPFIGVLFNINDIEYFAPLSSPKKKHLTMKNTLDFLKINHGIYGAINFNNMIPVTKRNYEVINLNRKKLTKDEAQYQELLINQYNWLINNKKQVISKALNLYKLYTNDKLFLNIKNRCCNYKLLEEKCMEYNKILV